MIIFNMLFQIFVDTPTGVEYPRQILLKQMQQSINSHNIKAIYGCLRLYYKLPQNSYNELNNFIAQAFMLMGHEQTPIQACKYIYPIFKLAMETKLIKVSHQQLIKIKSCYYTIYHYYFETIAPLFIGLKAPSSAINLINEIKNKFFTPLFGKQYSKDKVPENWIEIGQSILLGVRILEYFQLFYKMKHLIQWRVLGVPSTYDDVSKCISQSLLSQYRIKELLFKWVGMFSHATLMIKLLFENKGNPKICKKIYSSILQLIINIQEAFLPILNQETFTINRIDLLHAMIKWNIFQLFSPIFEQSSHQHQILDKRYLNVVHTVAQIVQEILAQEHQHNIKQKYLAFYYGLMQIYNKQFHIRDMKIFFPEIPQFDDQRPGNLSKKKRNKLMSFPTKMIEIQTVLFYHNYQEFNQAQEFLKQLQLCQLIDFYTFSITVLRISNPIFIETALKELIFRFNELSLSSSAKPQDIIDFKKLINLLKLLCCSVCINPYRICLSCQNISQYLACPICDCLSVSYEASEQARPQLKQLIYTINMEMTKIVERKIKDQSRDQILLILSELTFDLIF